MIFYHPRYLEHALSPMHPENPARLLAIIGKLKREKIFVHKKPEKAKVTDVKRVHSEEYIHRLMRSQYVGSEAPVHKQTWDIALLAAGGALSACRFCYENKRPSFALVRPPGHHAGKDYGGGFCYLNNAAIAIKNLGKRAAIIDLDLHHGNGTSDLFYECAQVLYISAHQYGIYPGTGELEETGVGEGAGFNVNIPLSAGCGDRTYELAFERVIAPIVTEFSPELTVVSFGTDAHYRDRLGRLTLSSTGYLRIAEKIIELAAELCAKRIAFMLEGGYDLEALAEVVSGIIARMQGKEIQLKHTKVSDKKGIPSIIDRVLKVHRAYWKV